jgi:hypothetical protein
MQMAAGTSCTSGVTSEFKISKRAVGRRAGARRFANPWVI